MPSRAFHARKKPPLVAKELRAAGCEVTDHFGKYDKPNFTVTAWSA